MMASFLGIYKMSPVIIKIREPTIEKEQII